MTGEDAVRVLVVDDEPVVRRTLARALLERGVAVDTAEGGVAALDLLRTRPVDAVLLDRAMPDMDGMATLGRMRQEHPDVEVVVMIPAGDPVSAARALAAGAYDVVDKPIGAPAAVARLLERAAERRRMGARVRALEQRISREEPLGEIIFASARMAELDRRASSAASTASPVLILGERGTGKELFGRAVHRRSNRAGEVLQVLRLGGLPPELVAAELAGALELAEGGTLLLDEVGELGAAAQGALARALAGAPRPDVRVVATAVPTLRERVKEGAFREDLFYRLGVILLEIPPLRRRKDDIPVLAYHFLSRFAPRAGKEIRRIGVETLRRLRDHAWPGNVRELGAVMEQATAMARGEVLMPADLPIGGEAARETGDGEEEEAPVRPGARAIAESEVFEMPYPEAKERAVHAFDGAYVAEAMNRARGNVSEAARLAGMDRSNFRRLAKKARGKG